MSNENFMLTNILDVQENKKRVMREVQKLKDSHAGSPYHTRYWQTLFELLLEDIDKLCTQLYDDIIIQPNQLTESELITYFEKIEQNIFPIYEEHMSPRGGIPTPYHGLSNDVEKFREDRKHRLETQTARFKCKYKAHLKTSKQKDWKTILGGIGILLGLIPLVEWLAEFI